MQGVENDSILTERQGRRGWGICRTFGRSCDARRRADYCLVKSVTFFECQNMSRSHSLAGTISIPVVVGADGSAVASSRCEMTRRGRKRYSSEAMCHVGAVESLALFGLSKERRVSGKARKNRREAGNANALAVLEEARNVCAPFVSDGSLSCVHTRGGVLQVVVCAGVIM